MCKWHCARVWRGQRENRDPEHSQMKRHNRRLISEGRGSDGEMEMVRGLSWVTQTEARKTVSLSSQGSHPPWSGGKRVLKQCLGSVQKALQSFKLLCAVYSSAALWKDGPVSPCSVTMGSTAEPPPALPSWGPVWGSGVSFEAVRAENPQAGVSAL